MARYIYIQNNNMTKTMINTGSPTFWFKDTASNIGFIFVPGLHEGHITPDVMIHTYDHYNTLHISRGINISMQLSIPVRFTTCFHLNSQVNYLHNIPVCDQWNGHLPWALFFSHIMMKLWKKCVILHTRFVSSVGTHRYTCMCILTEEKYFFCTTEIHSSINLSLLPSDSIITKRLRSRSTLLQVTAWCHQAPSHYLNQCWQCSSPNDVGDPQAAFSERPPRVFHISSPIARCAPVCVAHDGQSILGTGCAQ